MNKVMKMWMLAAILILSGAIMVGCQNKPDDTVKKSVDKGGIEAPAETKADVVDMKACCKAVDDYLVNEIGQHYSQGDVCIPYAFLVSTDNGNPEDILFWGDFWVFNYNLSGDTLKTVSGGNHPGLMHVKKTDDGYVVTNFDAVEDGAGNLESAKRIFGDKFDVYQEISSLQEKREDMRRRFTADYVKEHGLSATMIQEYGWPAVNLPE